MEGGDLNERYSFDRVSYMIRFRPKNRLYRVILSFACRILSRYDSAVIYKKVALNCCFDRIETTVLDSCIRRECETIKDHLAAF